jgi:deazaflavin-dependent oxidoreductase (nitroreductase family)
MEHSPIRWWQRIIQRLASIEFISSGFLAKYLHRWDTAVLKWSKGERSLTTLLTGLPVVVLTTTGARSGKPRTIPLAGFPDGGNIILVASSLGNTHNPGWYYNLKANPEVQLNINDQSSNYVARVVDKSERERYWQLALSYYPGYVEYEKRCGGREIPIVVLEPVT